MFFILLYGVQTLLHTSNCEKLISFHLSFLENSILSFCASKVRDTKNIVSGSPCSTEFSLIMIS